MRVGQSRRRDVGERRIIQALEAVGADVTAISGKGAPDLLVRWRDRLFGLEVKSKKGIQTEAQVTSKWPIVRSVEEALQAIGVRATASPGRGGAANV